MVTSATNPLLIRDFKTLITPNETQINTLIVFGLYFIDIATLWHIPYLKTSGFITHLYKISGMLTIVFHEMSHAFVGVLICATIHSITIKLDHLEEVATTNIEGGKPLLILPAGYTGASFIGACLIACGFDTNASKVASIVLAVPFLATLWWARRNRPTCVVILGMSCLIVAFWFIDGGVALRYLVLFIGVMSCMHSLLKVIYFSVHHKDQESDISNFARRCGYFPSYVWGIIWFIVAFIYFAFGIIIGLLAFKKTAQQQMADAAHFLPVPGSRSGAISLAPSSLFLSGTLQLLLTIVGFL